MPYGGAATVSTQAWWLFPCTWIDGTSVSARFNDETAPRIGTVYCVGLGLARAALIRPQRDMKQTCAHVSTMPDGRWWFLIRQDEDGWQQAQHQTMKKS